MQSVCVQGLGFVGAAMAAAVAQARDAKGAPRFEVVGVDLPTATGLKRIEAINAGRFPFNTADPGLTEAVKRGRASGNLRATADAAAYETADVVLVDVELDVDFENHPPSAEFNGFRQAIQTLATRVKPGTLIIIETTVPPGTTERVVLPLLQDGLMARGIDPASVLVAHSFERIMPGRDYLASITHFWRVYAGVTAEAADACEKFLAAIIDTNAFPLTRLSRPVESETAKLMENSFRAVNIALIEEWGRFAERAGIDLMAVIQAIRVRPTHRNMMRPGFGVGGYCLTKDPLLVGIGARELFGFSDLTFPFCEAAVRTNEEMPKATIAILNDALGGIRNKRILLLGASYREEVADTRHSPSVKFVRWARTNGAIVDIHDPLVESVDELEDDVIRTLPAPNGYAAAVFAVGHQAYRNIEPRSWLRSARPLIVDANCVLSQAQIDGFQENGCRVKVVGRGDL
jgi:UDP-N-acetyl-D-glucosamine dehydrogenase